MYFRSIIRIALKRLLTQRGLTLATTLGLVISVALAMSVPLYADSILHRMLTERLEGDENSRSEPNAPFSLLFEHLQNRRGAAQWADLEAVDTYLTSGAAERDLGLPLQFNVRYFKTYALGIYAAEADTATANAPIATASLGTLTGFEDYITVIDGRLPDPGGKTIEVVISERQSEMKDLHPGQSYLAFYHDTVHPERPDVNLPILIVGVWQAADPNDPFWFFEQVSFDETLLIPEPTFLEHAAELESQRWISEWYLVPDPSSVRSDVVDDVIARVTTVEKQATAALPTVKPRILPVDLLEQYQEAARQLTFSLFVFSVPIVGLLVAFISLVVSLAVERRRSEIATLRSRGASLWQIVGIAGIEGAVMCGLALAIGLPLSERLTRAMGHTRSFLNFTLPGELDLRLTRPALIFGIAILALALLVQLIPTSSAARQTVVTYRQERARELKPVWWQRVWLDVLLLIAAGYGIYVVRSQGSLAEATQTDPFHNPLLILVPALGIFAASLFLLRILPRALALVAWVAARTPSVSLVLAARHLARAPAFYGAPLVLLILTLSLATFTASLASTLDSHLLAQQRYQTGSDLFLKETGECLRTLPIRTYGSAPRCDTSASLEEGPIWQFPPAGDHLKVPGVETVTRVGNWDAEAAIGTERIKGVFLGIEPGQLSQVAYWRQDYSPVSLDVLMSQVTDDSVVVSRDFLTGNKLEVGDPVGLYVTAGRIYRIERKIAGTFSYFPTWYQQTDGPAFVGDLDAFFREVGGEYPYNVWAKTPPDLDFRQTVEDLRLVNIFPAIKIEKWTAAPMEIAEQQGQPDRQGLFGLLSVGFIASALLTVLGFFLYALFSFRKRFIEVGIMRAIGLSARQMILYLAWEQAFLIGIGLLMGTVLGILMGELFIPTLQFGTEAAELVPPFQVQIAWGALVQIYALFGVLFVGASSGLAMLLRRMKVFQAIKLGETV
ncbi:MAG: FtsX-like permease family protein [Anaerolineae bacterium]|nr:FtsX-like permease family protein [Anaerolineae bacterium]